MTARHTKRVTAARSPRPSRNPARKAPAATSRRRFPLAHSNAAPWMPLAALGVAIVAGVLIGRAASLLRSAAPPVTHVAVAAREA